MTFAECSIRSDGRPVAVDWRSDDTDHAVMEACLAELQGFEIECTHYRHETNADKRLAVARSAQIARQCRGSQP